jgi:hypothetical protein
MPIIRDGRRRFGLHCSSLRPTVEQVDSSVLRPVSWLTDNALDRLPEPASRRSVTSLISDDPPTVAGAAAELPVKSGVPEVLTYQTF